LGICTPSSIALQAEFANPSTMDYSLCREYLTLGCSRHKIYREINISLWG
jgi:hypothetical protein